MSDAASLAATLAKIYNDGLVRGRAEGFAAGEASMREKALHYLQVPPGRHGHGHDFAKGIEAIPPSSPAVWAAESLANGERDASGWHDADDDSKSKPPSRSNE